MNNPTKALAVLIVEDMESDAQLIVRLLKKADYELVYEQVESAGQMRSALEKRAWDIVISDYKLPQFDGNAALKLLQEMGRDIPFIVVSGTIGEETAVAMMKAGAHDYLIKGDLARLVPAVERELEQSKIRRARKQAEEALKESEEKYRELVQGLPDAIVIYIDGRIVFANNASVELMRAKNAADLLGRSVIELVHPDSKEFVKNRMLKVMKERKPLPLVEIVDEKFIRFDGSEVNVEVKALPIMFEKKSAVQLIFRDITARKKAEIEIKEQTEELELINKLNEAVNHGESLDKIIKLFAKELGGISLCKDAAIYMLSPDGKSLVMQHLRLSPAMIKNVEQLIGMPIPQIQIPIMEDGYFQHALQSEHGIITTDPKIIQSWMLEFTETNYLPAATRKTVQKLIPQIYKLLNIRSTIIIPLATDKKVVGLLDVSSAGILTEKELTRIRNISSQVTSVILRKQAEEALQASEERYRSLFDRMLDGMYRSTHAGKFVDVNPAMVKMFGYSSREEMLEMDIKNELYFDPKERGTHIIDTGHGETDVYRLRRKDGSEIWVEDRGNYTYDEQGGIVFHEGMMRDVTERVQAQKALAASEAELRALFASMQDVVLVIDRQGMYRKIAPTNPGLLVKPPAELLGRNLRDVFPAEQAEIFIGTLQQVLDTKQTTQIEYELLIGDRTVWFETSISPMDKDSTLWVARDVSGRRHMEQSLREREQQYRSLVEQLPAIVYIDDATAEPGHTLYVSPQIETILGVSQEEWLQGNLKVWADYIHPDDRARAQAEYIQCFQAGEQIDSEYRMISVDGRLIWIRDQAVMLRDENDRPHLLHGVMYDITERRQAEEALRVSEEKYRALFENSAVAIGMRTTDGRYIEFNRAYSEMLGYTREELLSRSTADVTHPEDVVISRSNMASVAEGRAEIRRYQKRYLHKNGSVVWGDVCIQPLQDSDGNVTAIIGAVVNITERRQAEEALRESEERFRSVFENAAIGLYRTTPDERILLANTTFARMLGCESVDELMQRNKDGDSVVTEYPRSEFLQIMERKGEVKGFEAYGKRIDGTFIFVRENAKVVRDSNGEILYFEGSVEDITERKRAEEKLMTSQQRYRQLVEGVPGIVYSFSNKRGGIYYSSRAEEILGYTPDYLYANPMIWHDSIHPDDLERVNYTIQNFEHELNIEYRVRNARGEWRWLADRSIGRDVKNDEVIIDGLAIDITERVLAQEVVRQSEEKLKKAQHFAHVGSWSWNIKTNELEWSDEMYHIFGVNKETFSGVLSDVVSQSIHPDDRYKVEQSNLSVINEARPIPLEYRIIWPDGSEHVVWAEAGELIVDETGQPSILSGTVQDITLRKQAEEAIRQRVTELELLYESGLALSQLLDPKEIGRKMIGLLEEKLDWHHTTIRLYRPNDESLELLAFNQPGLKTEMERRAVEEHFKTLVSRSGEGLSGWAVQNSRAVRSGDVGNDSRYAETFPGLHSGLYVPMKLGERMVGVISIESEKPNAFSEADEQLVITLANQAASAFENARLFEETRQRALELETLNRISLVLRAISKQDEMLSIVLDEALAILNTSHGSIELWDGAGGNLQKTITRGWLAQVTEPPHNSDEGITGKVFTSGETYISREFASDPETRAASRSQIPPGWGGACLPIRTTQQTLGVMIVSVPSGRELNKDEMRLLSTLAEMTGGALHRMRLFDETARRAEELTTLQATVLDISSPHPLQELLNLIVERAANLLGASSGGLYLTEPEHRRVRCLVSYKTKQDFTGTLLDYGVGAAGYVAETGKPMIIDDYRSWSGRAGVYEDGQPFDAVMSAPMLWQGQVIGVIHLLRDDSSQKFTQEELNLLALFANHAAVAVENAHLLESTQQHVRELTALHRASQTLLAARLDPEHICDAVHQAVAQTMPCEAFVIVLDDEDGGDYHAVYFFDKGERFAPKRLPRGAGLSGHVISLGKSLLVDDLQTENDLPMTHFGSREVVRSILAVPLRRGDEVIGMLSTQSYQPHAFSEAKRLLLETISAQLASAIDNARLYQQTQSRLKELQALHKVSVSLRTAQTLEEALPILLDETLAALETDSGSILLYHPASNDLQRTFARGWFIDLQNIPIKPGEGVAGTVLATGKIYFSQEFVRDALPHVATRDKIPAGWGGACLPIRAGSESVGVLFVSVHLPRQITSGQMKLLNSLAEIAGATLHRMRLHDETARRAEEFASLYETSKTLSSESELDSLLQSIVKHAQTLLNSNASGIYLYDKEHQEVEIGVYTAPYMSIGMRQGLGEGVAGRVAQTRQPLRVDDYSTWAGRLPKFSGTPFRAVLGVPMLYGGELIGVLVVDEIGDSERKFTEADERLLSLFASQAAGAIHSARLHEETVHRLENLQAMRAVDQAIASSLDMRLTLNIILTHALPQLGVDAADVLLLRSSSNLLEIAASRGLRTRLLESVTLSESFAGRAVMEHRTITVSDIETAGQHSQFAKLWKEEDFSAYWCVPLIVKGEVRGVLEVYRRTAFTPDAEWLEFLETLASQAAIAIENAQLFENLQRANMDLILAYNDTIEGWSRALDLRDRETEGHTQRVADLTEAIAKAMGIKDKEMIHIRRGALLHDMGKMGVPDQILLKPDKLTDEEWVIMRTHPQLARDMLMPIAYLRDALDIPYSHHEKWDGTGYPQGLKGQQIPLTARFFAVVDVWDALTSDRPYRKKWTKKKALAYIHKQRGRHFDPQVVDAFEKIVKVK